MWGRRRRRRRPVEDLSDEEWLERMCTDLKDHGLDTLEADSHRIPNVRSLEQLMDAIRVNHSLTFLKLCRFGMTGFLAQLFVPALRRHSTLQVLHLEDCDDDVEDDNNENEPMDSPYYHENQAPVSFLDALAVALVNHPSITALHLRACQLQPSSSWGLLVGASRLTELRVCHCTELFQDPLSIHALALGIRQSETLHIVDLTGNALNDEAVHVLSRAFMACPITFLSLDFNAFEDAGVASLSTMLAHHVHLTELSLFGNRVSAQGAQHVACALESNRTLQSLILSFNQIGDGGAAALAKALTVNTTLTNLWFPSNSISCHGMQLFAQHLPHMAGLEQLNVGMLLDTKAAEALTLALKDNLRLSVLYMEQAIEEEDQQQDQMHLDFYLRLNRSGRRAFRDKTVPQSCWADLLANSHPHNRDDGVPDVLFYLLREKPDLMERAGR